LYLGEKTEIVKTGWQQTWFTWCKQCCVLTHISGLFLLF